MRQKKPKQGLKGLPGWMASYADMFTLLMAFFVLLFAMSVVDQELFEQFIVSFNPARADDFININGGGGDTLIDAGAGILPVPIPPPPAAEADQDGDGAEEGVDGTGTGVGDTVSDIADAFRTYMAQEFWEGVFDLETIETEHYLRILIPTDENMLFASGQSSLLPQATVVLDMLGPQLLDFTRDGHGIVVEGHTDNIPINTPQFPSNWSLSTARAASVVEFLHNNWHIEPNYLIPLGRGEFFPVAPNTTAEGRAQNRRVEIQVFTREATGGIIGSWFIIPGTAPR